MTLLQALEALQPLGWKTSFAQQLASYPETLHIARVVEVQRGGLRIAPQLPNVDLVPLGGRWFQLSVEQRPTVGDWILIDPADASVHAMLERTSLIKRLAPSGDLQLIAANIDTAFIVSSCNADFSVARIERYMSVVLQADIQPVVVLTKADTTDDVYPYLDAVRALDSHLPVEAVNALDLGTCQGLLGWCGAGQSIALLGSSGVGKSTLVNTLSGAVVQQTKAAREDDDKGRHTTTHRSLHLLPQGGVILDSPGMREFQIADAASGVTALFDDIEQLAQLCRFNDCTHDSEPGCAVQAAIADGRLDERRLQSFFKLQREEAHNSATVAQQRSRARAFNKMTRAAASRAKLKRQPN